MTASVVPSRRRMTLNDVAMLARVDRSVVSRVFNNDPRLNIRPETRQRVHDAMKELGYRPNVMARSLRTSRAGTLGLLIPDFTNPVYAEIIIGAEEEAALAGSVLVTGSAFQGNDPTKSYLDLLGQGRVDGLLLASPMDTENTEELMARTGLPWLFLNRYTENATRYIALDEEKAARLAVQHLVDLGHKRIGYITGPEELHTSLMRRTGWESVLNEAGLPARNELVAKGTFNAESGAQAARELLTADEPPTAIFVSNIAAAIGVIYAAWEHGLQVPNDLSVVSIHDHALAPFVVPGVTTVKMPLRELGARGVRRLLDSRQDEVVAETVDLGIELIVRGSTAPPLP